MKCCVWHVPVYSLRVSYREFQLKGGKFTIVEVSTYHGGAELFSKGANQLILIEPPHPHVQSPYKVDLIKTRSAPHQ